MGKTTTLLVISLLLVNLCFSISSVDASAASNLAFLLPVTGGTIADYISDESEFDLDSEINRRLLATRKRYISYGALSRNTVPCSRRGASYYNCRQGAQANPYNRGCSAITRCRRWGSEVYALFLLWLWLWLWLLFILFDLDIWNVILNFLIVILSLWRS